MTPVESPPTPEERRDPFRMWLDQVHGRRHFEKCEFMGLLNDAAALDDWPALFADLPDSDGFVARLAELYRLQTPGTDGSSGHLYLAPLEQNAEPPDVLVDLVRAHLADLVRLGEAAPVDQSGASGPLRLMTRGDIAPLVQELRDAPVRWGGERLDLEPLRSGAGLNDGLYDMFGDLLRDGQRGWSDTLRCLGEACYTLAAEYDLQRWLMRDFNTLPVDHEAWFRLWVAGGDFVFDDSGACIVTSVKRRAVDLARSAQSPKTEPFE